MATFRLVDVDKLNNLFGGIANKIREITGKNSKVEVDLNNKSSNQSIETEIDKIAKIAAHNAIRDFVGYYTSTIKTLIIKDGSIRIQASSNSGVENVSFENCTSITSQKFFEDSILKCARFKNLEFMGSGVFNCCANLEKVIIETPLSSPDSDAPPCTLEEVDALSSTPIESWMDNAGVYVPADTVSLYENDSNWCCFPIFPIPSKEEDPDGYRELYGAFEEMEAILC